jgi:hypothetical protein
MEVIGFGVTLATAQKEKGVHAQRSRSYAKWAENKKEKDAKFAERRGQRDKASNYNAGSKDSNVNGNAKKLALSKHLSAALTTQIGISDADATKFAEAIPKSAKV